jgi:hypothetical protein
MKIPSLRQILTHQLAKRLAVAMPISVGIGLLLTWLGEHSVLISLVTGIGAYIFADWLFSTPEERQDTHRQVTTFFREHWAMAAKWGIYIAMCAYFFGSRGEPADPAVKQVLILVQTFGFFAVFIVPIFASTIIYTAGGGMRPSVAVLASRLLKGLVFYSMALWLIGAGGDALYKLILANPGGAAIGAVAFVIVWMIVRFSAGLPVGSESVVRSLGAAAATASVVARKATARDNRYTAAHEAGHALVYAALGGLPVDVKLAVNDFSDGRGVLGFVTGITSQHHLDERSFAEWYMLVFLAGKLGETVMYGESTLSSSNDHLRWLGVARRYLANHYRGIYYDEPQNEFEQKQNEAKLEALQTEQLALLSRLFDLNTEAFNELAASLLEKRTLARHDLIPFLSRVQLPPEFPLPFGPFDQFSNGE